MVHLLAGCASSPQRESINVLVFSRTEGFRHDSIPAGVRTMHELCADSGYGCVSTEYASLFTKANLEQFRVIVFLNTTGDVLNDAQQQAVEAWFMDAGVTRGFVGIHSAADTEYDWPFYQRLIGAAFKNHPPVQEAVVQREDAEHPAVSFLPERWARVDEWYNYRSNPRDAGATVLLALDTSSYQGSEMPGDHPIAWCRKWHPRGQGGPGSSYRMFYTGGGHTIESFSEPLFRTHLLFALRWAAHDEID